MLYNIASTEANTSQPTKDNSHSIIYITTLSNAHNHELSPYREKFFANIEFTQEMCERVEFYTNVVKLRPLQIQKALQKEFPDHKIYLSEIYKLAEALEAIINEERNKSKYIYWKTQILLTSTVITLPQVLFSEIDKALSCFLTPAMLKVQRIEIKCCLNY
ncbi:24310_t:CDS:2 [Gigaspora rosea]|nr:24310_t:CDS:2 [Gigaspora rosea]